MAGLSQQLEVFRDAGVTKGQLVTHAIRVEHCIVLVTKGHAALVHEMHHRGQHLRAALRVHVVTHFAFALFFVSQERI